METTELTDFEFTWLSNRQSHARPIAQAIRQKHHYNLNRGFIVEQIVGELLNGASIKTLDRMRLQVKIERQLFETINAIDDAQLEELWDRAEMDFVMSKLFGGYGTNAPSAYGVVWALMLFWRNFISPLPSALDYPELKKPPMALALGPHPGMHFPLDRLRDDWLRRIDAKARATNVPGKVPGV